MKTKRPRLICLIMSLVIIFTAAATLAVGVRADDPAYERRDVTAYLYSLDKTETVECLFFDALPNEPYIDALDFLRHAYITEFTSGEEDGKIVIKDDFGDGMYALMICDPENDTVTFDNVFQFFFYGAYAEGSDRECDFLMGSDFYSSSDEMQATLDLGAYDFDIVAVDGKIYFPLTLISDIFVDSYNYAVYIDGNIYFAFSLSDFYYDKSSIYDDLDRSAADIKYTYDLLCFELDRIYGLPSSAKLAPFIAEMGFDRALDEYDDVTRKAKELLLSDNNGDFMSGMFCLFPYLDDGGHTVISIEANDANYYYPNSPVVTRFLELYSAGDELSDMIGAANDALTAPFYRNNLLFEAKNAAIEGKELVNSWNNGSQLLLAEGNTAIYIFDIFDNDVPETYKWSLDWAAQNGIRNFVIDLSTNGGGNTTVLEYILATLNGSNTITRGSRETITGVDYYTVNQVDVNLDGEFDENDDISYDFDFAILTSHYSFSCANTLPVLAQDEGIMIIGTTSGGGSCIVVQPLLPGGHYYYMSSDLKFVSSSGADFDLGAPVDVDLSSTDEEGNVDYSGLYDFASFGKLMKAFYHVEGDANGDGVFNAKDIVAAMKFLVGCEIDGFSDYVADFNDDGRLNAKDVVAMMRSIVGAAEQEAMSYAEYAAAAVGDEVVIEAWIQDKQSRWDGKASVYLQDEDGGYFAYEMVCSEQDYEKLVPGTKIRVSGTKAMWPEENGEIEIASGCTFEFVGNAPSVIFDATDVTGLVGDDVLATMMNRRVSFKGLTVVAQSDGSAFAYKDAENKTDDLYFTAEIDGKKIDFCVEFYLRGNDSDVYKAVEALNVGDVIDVEAFLYWYNGANPHVVGITVK